MAIRGSRVPSGTLKKEVQIVSSHLDGTVDAPTTYNVEGLGNISIDAMIDYMRDAGDQIEAQKFANAIPRANWRRLPGGSADFGQESTSLTDTIFGDGYDSMFPGLITGSITANALIKGIPGYQVVIRQTSRSIQCTDVVLERVPTSDGSKVFRFPNKDASRTTKSPTCTFDIDNKPIPANFAFGPVGNVNSTFANGGTIKVDYLFGEVTLEGGNSGNIMDDYNVHYNGGMALPLTTVGRAQNYNLTQTLNPVDETDFDTAQQNDGHRRFVPGLKSANLELSGFWRNKNNFLTQLEDRQKVLLYIDPTGQGDAIAAMYCFLMRQGQRGDVGALEEESVNFELNVIDDDNLPDDFEPISWKFNYYTRKAGETDANSIVSVANQMLLDAWLCGTHVGVRYLPNGLERSGKEITTGYTTAAIVTDASLSSSLDGVAEFQASFQLDGHVARRGQITQLARLNAMGEVTNDLVISDDEEMIIELRDENGNPMAARADLTLQITGANNAKYRVDATMDAAGIAGNVIPEGVARKTITIEHLANAANNDSFTLEFLNRPVWINSDVKFDLMAHVP